MSPPGSNVEITIEMADLEEEILNDDSSCDLDEITGSPELRMEELRLTILCWVFSIKFFQMVFASAFTLVAIQWDALNETVEQFYWILFITAFLWLALFYCIKKIRHCRRFPLNLILLLIMTTSMAYTFAGIAINVRPFTYIVLVGLATASTIYFMVIPVAFLLKVNENGYGMYKHIVVTTCVFVVFAHLPYFLSIRDRYPQLAYWEFLLNLVCGALLGAILCLEAFFNFKRHMNSGRLTSLANLESIFSASIS